MCSPLYWCCWYLISTDQLTGLALEECVCVCYEISECMPNKSSFVLILCTEWLLCNTEWLVSNSSSNNLMSLHWKIASQKLRHLLVYKRKFCHYYQYFDCLFIYSVDVNKIVPSETKTKTFPGKMLNNLYIKSCRGNISATNINMNSFILIHIIHSWTSRDM